MKGKGKGRLWSWLLALPLAAFLLYWSLRGVDWKNVWHLMAGARWRFLAACCVCSAFSFFLRSLRWRILLNAEQRLPVGAVFCATMAGYLGNAFLPARAGELVRTLVVNGRSTLSRTYVLTTALSERLMDVVALVLWASLILLGVHPKPDWMAGVARTLAGTASLGAIAIAILPHTGDLCQNLIRRLPLPPAARERLVELTGQVLLGMRAFHHVGRFLGFATLTAAIWAVDASSMMIAAQALRLTLSFQASMLLVTGLGLGSALPSTPGYVGIYQFVAVTVLVPMGIPKAAALAYILLTQAAGYVVVLALGLPCLYALRASAPPPALPARPMGTVE